MGKGSKIGIAAGGTAFAKAMNNATYQLSPDEQAAQMAQHLDALEEYTTSAVGKAFAKAANDATYQLSPDEQAAEMTQRLDGLEEHAQSPDATISGFLKKYETGHSELKSINASPDDVSAIIDGYEKNAAIIELSPELQDRAAIEAQEIAADIAVSYTHLTLPTIHLV